MRLEYIFVLFHTLGEYEEARENPLISFESEALAKIMTEQMNKLSQKGDYYYARIPLLKEEIE